MGDDDDIILDESGEALFVEGASVGLGVGGHDDGRCDDGEFALDSADVAEEAAAERKEVRRVMLLLSELQVRAGVAEAGAGEGPAEVEKDVEEQKDAEIVCFAGTRSWAICAKIPR
jgi:hypothetical protein